MQANNDETWRLFWAKTDRSGKRPEWTRPLWAHLIDVANAAEALWESHVSEALKQRLAKAVNLAPNEAKRWWSYMLGIHDLGKAIPSFQDQHKPSRQILQQQGLRFPLQFDRVNRIHHGYASIGIIERWLDRQDGLSDPVKETYRAIAAFIGFHHGKPAAAANWRDDRIAKLGGKEWQREHELLLNAVQKAWDPPDPTLSGHRHSWPTWVLGLAGWCTLSDWLGSMEKCFPDVASNDDLRDYIPISKAAIAHALSEAGFDHSCALTERPFQEIFPFKDEHGKLRDPRDLQQLMIDLPLAEGSAPTLTIVEAPTGEGKTESALYLAVRQQVLSSQTGIYIAMPTQATSNGLFIRFKNFLAKAHNPEAGPVNLVLVHGASNLHADQEKLVEVFLDARRTLSEVYEENNSGHAATPQSPHEPRLETAEWFLPKKRSLLAPYGIGTVDQALLGVLFAKHFFLRLYGLSGKTVIFDEVHAYDTYMSELFRLLLSWLKEMGTNIILLSATLPAIARRGFIEAWGGSSDEWIPSPEQLYPKYPAVWQIGNSDTRLQLFGCNASFSYRTSLAWGNPTYGVVVENVVMAVREHATVIVIVNTVARAQQLYQMLASAIANDESLDEVDMILFHARFPFGIRTTIEQNVLTRFGKERPSLHPAILVATQVAEQSLDLDADVMFSDLAPIDLLLQRAGRLHRHQHHQRPAAYATPVLKVLYNKADEGSLPDIEEVSGWGKVYERSIMFRTWDLLRDRTEWQLPNEYRVLIESVYGLESSAPPIDLDENARKRWSKAEHEFNEQVIKEQNEAKGRIIQQTDEIREMVASNIVELEEDEGTAHKDFIAFTRSGGPSVQVVCLHEDEERRLWLDIDHNDPLPAQSQLPLSREQIRLLQNVAVRLSGERMFWMLSKLTDKRWDSIASETPSLARHRPLIFRDRHWRDDKGNHIEYDTTLGILYHSKEE